MFVLGEKLENNTFWPFLTPQKRNFVGPCETSWSICGIWGSLKAEPQIPQSNVHCILPLHCFAGSAVLSRQNLKSGMPDLRFFRRQSNTFCFNYHQCTLTKAGNNKQNSSDNSPSKRTCVNTSLSNSFWLVFKWWLDLEHQQNLPLSDSESRLTWRRIRLLSYDLKATENKWIRNLFSKPQLVIFTLST